ncbi:hypothetical protein BHE74_00019861 [Ensete ventricosum]|nr:hypothetical protein GW17_00054624 [Ensete ventricosum]RWW72329.1 hypothetical protein BHE74_00019861 [Ensete ventricosum]RZR88231.1 hypothetical protein BHM03_00015772 [Ensete ventricosum]
MVAGGRRLETTTLGSDCIEEGVARRQCDTAVHGNIVAEEEAWCWQARHGKKAAVWGVKEKGVTGSDGGLGNGSGKEERKGSEGVVGQRQWYREAGCNCRGGTNDEAVVHSRGLRLRYEG